MHLSNGVQIIQPSNSNRTSTLMDLHSLKYTFIHSVLYRATTVESSTYTYIYVCMYVFISTYIHTLNFSCAAKGRTHYCFDNLYVGAQGLSYSYGNPHPVTIAKFRDFILQKLDITPTAFRPKDIPVGSYIHL
jgi:hypothetical protein